MFTDLGFACEKLIDHFSKCHAAFLEANYDEEMLEKGHYPFYLKKRIRSEHGHLSNAQALELFLKHRSPFLSQLILAHLSKENNSPLLVEEIFSAQAGETKITVASRYEESEVFMIVKQGNERKMKSVTSHGKQASLPF